MKEADVEIIIQRAKEKFPDARPRIISDNGPQFIARDFKEFIRLSGMTHPCKDIAFLSAVKRQA
jgi:transposase InsO family protein